MTKETVNRLHTAIVCRRAGTSYTCIRVAESDTHTSYIPMETLQLVKVDSREFHMDWEAFDAYPVRRAAELYLATPFREISDKARAHLERIVVDPTTVYEIEPKPAVKTAQPKKEPNMARAKKVSAPVTESPAKASPKATKVAGSKTDVTKTAPTKQVAAKTAPAKGNLPARAADDKTYQVIESDKPRRGETAEYVAVAQKLKTFTRQKLIDAMVKIGKEEAKARVKVADMVYFKVVEAV